MCDITAKKMKMKIKTRDVMMTFIFFSTSTSTRTHRHNTSINTRPDGRVTCGTYYLRCNSGGVCNLLAHPYAERVHYYYYYYYYDIVVSMKINIV